MSLVLLCSLAYGTPAPAPGKVYHDQAIGLPDSHQAMRIAFLRTAVRLSPNVARFQNNLGVMEMRMGNHLQAKNRFIRAAALGAAPARRSLELLQDIVPAFDFTVADHRQGGKKLYEFPELIQEHTIGPVQRIPAKELFKAKWQKHREGKVPFILTDALAPDAAVVEKSKDLDGGSGEETLQQWNRSFWTLESLMRQFPDEVVDFYPHGMQDEKVNPKFASLRTALEQLAEPTMQWADVDASMPGTYIQWNLPPAIWDGAFMQSMGWLPPLFREDERWLGECFPTETARDAETRARFFRQSHWRMLLVGERGAGMFNHKDTLRVSSYQVQLNGTKRWHLCHGPTQDQYLYEAGDVNSFAPDYDRYPLFRKASCLQAEVGPGEALFYSSDWWHQTQALDTPTVSLSGSVVDRTNWRTAKQEFETECGARPRIMHPDEEVCAALRSCFKRWQSDYGP